MSKAITTAAKPSGKLRCDRIYQNVLLPNGDVVLCCMDWSAEYVLGNLKRDQFEDLYRSETFRRVLRGLKDPSVDILCRTCHCRSIRGRKGSPHDRDPQHSRHWAGRRPNFEPAQASHENFGALRPPNQSSAGSGGLAQTGIGRRFRKTAAPLYLPDANMGGSSAKRQRR